MTIELINGGIAIFVAIIFTIVFFWERKREARIRKEFENDFKRQKATFIKGYVNIQYPTQTPLKDLSDYIEHLQEINKDGLEFCNALILVKAKLSKLYLKEVEVICDAYDSGYDAVWYNETTNGSFYYNNNFKSQSTEK